MTARTRRRPDLPHEKFARQAKHPKPQYLQSNEPADTSDLPLRKIHPWRVPKFLHWLTFKSCVIAGKVDQLTDQIHICWHPERRGFRLVSDPMHLSKAISGRIKQDDRYAIPGCRLAHNMQEGDDERFARRFEIDTRAIAESLFAEFCAEEERRR